MSLNQRFIAFALVISIMPILVLTLVMRHELRSDLDEEIGQSLRVSTHLMAQQLDSYVHRKTRETTILTQADVLETSLYASMARYLNEASVENRDGTQYYLFGLNGQEVANSLQLDGEAQTYVTRNIDSHAFFSATKGKQGEVFLTEVEMSAEFQSFFILTPVTDDSNLNTLYVLAAKVPMQTISTQLKAFRDISFGKTSLHLISDDGIILASSQDTANIGSMFDDVMIVKKLQAAFSREGSIGYTRYTDANQHNKLVGFADMAQVGVLKSHDWSLIGVGDYQEMASSISSLETTFVWMATFIALLAVMFAYGMAYGLANPLDRVIRMAQQISSSQHDSLVPVTDGPKEIQTLSQALMQSVGALQVKTKNLEVAKKKAEDASAVKSAFLSVMSHELRTPLNGILGMAQIIEMKSNCPEDVEYARLIQGAGNDLLTVLNDILDFSRIEAGEMTLKYNRHDLTEVVSSVHSIFQQLCEEKNIEFDIQFEELKDVLVECDAARIRQIIWNLVGNGVKFTSQGHVIVTLKLCPLGKGPKSHELCIIVEDTGIGIAKEDFEKIFEPFLQVDTTLARTFEGSGLGLSIVRRLVYMMNGTISVTSELAEGTRIVVTMPVDARVKTAAERAIDTRSVPTQLAQSSHSSFDLFADEENLV